MLYSSVFSANVRTAVKAVLIAFLLCALLSMTSFDALSREVSQDIVRLHILADSDSVCDQNIKLMVRDAVQSYCCGLYPDGCTKAQAIGIICENMPGITSAAQSVLDENEIDSTVSCELVNTYFTTRRYRNFTLPAGKYDALKISIGSGRGHNWWCVMFPPVCVAASDAELSDVLDDGETRLVSDGVEYKFKLYEIYECFCEKLTKK